MKTYTWFHVYHYCYCLQRAISLVQWKVLRYTLKNRFMNGRRRVPIWQHHYRRSGRRVAYLPAKNLLSRWQILYPVFSAFVCRHDDPIIIMSISCTFCRGLVVLDKDVYFLNRRFVKITNKCM